jgi:hypothetical protein
MLLSLLAQMPCGLSAEGEQKSIGFDQGKIRLPMLCRFVSFRVYSRLKGFMTLTMPTMLFPFSPKSRAG